MKFWLFTSIFALSISIANAGPGSSRMAMLINEINFSRTVPMQKRFFHTKLKTKGFRPEETTTIPQRHILPWPKKIEYLDDTYEVFRTPPGFIERLEESVKRSHTEQSLPETTEKKVNLHTDPDKHSIVNSPFLFEGRTNLTRHLRIN